MASIYKRKSKDDKSFVWRAVIRIKGYPTVCKTGDRKQIVEDWAKDTERRIKLGQYNFEAHNKNHTYADLLLVSCLSPRNQMENLLVEKIAIDFWRLRRTIKFETGSISKHISTMLKSHYSYDNKDNARIDEEIQYTMKRFEWNAAYLKCLERSEVTFDQPMWANKGIESDIIEDFYLIARSLSNLTKEERNRLYERSFTFAEFTALLKRHGYSQTKEISDKLVELYSKENQHLKEQVHQLEKQKLSNESADKLNYALGMIPPEENADKILKYERSIQKSIFQNLFLLKKLPGPF
ncbi:MAG: hypothetical protein V4494_07380 [Chlamydiota bacterium]